MPPAPPPDDLFDAALGQRIEERAPRAAVSQRAGVSRSFTYGNAEVQTITAAAQTTAKTAGEGRMEATTAQQELSWRERALNVEDQVRETMLS